VLRHAVDDTGGRCRSDDGVGAIAPSVVDHPSARCYRQRQACGVVQDLDRDASGFGNLLEARHDVVRLIVVAFSHTMEFLEGSNTSLHID
jgi:hypothetical protein